MAKRGNRSKALHTALAFWATVVIGAGALGWGVSVRFAAPSEEARHNAGAPRVLLRLRPVWLPDVDSLVDGSSLARSSPPGSVPAPRRSSGLHMAFSQEWPQGSYEIGSSGHQQPSPPVRFVCGACPAVNWALNLSPDASSDREKLMVDAATFGIIRMAGNGRVTLLEWNP